MKRMLLLFTLLTALLLFATSALANEALMQDLSTQTFELSSGVGAWSTTLNLAPDGSFTGLFHDADMGDSDEGYPDGTVYFCRFSGMLTIGDPISDYAYRAEVASLVMDQAETEPFIADGVRYIPATPYGLENMPEMILYLPGAPMGELPEGYLNWAHIAMIDRDADELPFYGLYNVTDDLGFTSYPAWDNDMIEVTAADWQLPESTAVIDIPADVFSQATTAWIGTTLEAKLFIGFREVDAGVDYAYVCLVTPVVPNAQAHWSIVTIHQGFDGECTIISMDDINL